MCEYIYQVIEERKHVIKYRKRNYCFGLFSKHGNKTLLNHMHNVFDIANGV